MANRAKAVEGNQEAYVAKDGDMYWRDEKGEYNRGGDKPAVIMENSTVYWYKDGKLHRDGDKPAAFAMDGGMAWYKDGKLHREGGKPAVIFLDGTVRYYENGVQYFPQESKRATVGTAVGEKEKLKATIFAIPEDVKLGEALIIDQQKFPSGVLLTWLPDVEERVRQIRESWQIYSDAERQSIITMFGRNVRQLAQEL